VRGEVEGEGPEGEGGGEDVGVGQRALGEPDGVDGGEEGDGDGGSSVEEPLGETEDGKEAGGGEGSDEQAGREDVEAYDVPERAEEDVGQRRVGVGEVRDQLAGVVEVQSRGNVVAALVPEVRKVKQGEMGEGDGCEEQEEEDRRGNSREPGGGVRSIGGSFHVVSGRDRCRERRSAARRGPRGR